MKQINIYTKSCDKYRIFSTKQFSIHDLSVQLQRYNPYIQVIALWLSDEQTDLHANNETWKSLSMEELDADMQQIDGSGDRIEIIYTKDLQEFLKTYNYRVALTVYYVNCLFYGDYPKKNPFYGVKINEWLPEDIALRLNVKRLPAFVKNEENPFFYFSDILLYFNGRKIERMYCGEEVRGYLLESCRYENNLLNQSDND